MKRIGCKLLIVVCLVISLMCFPLSTFADTADNDNKSNREVTVYKLNGIVTVTRDDGSHPSVFTGTEIESGDKVEVEKGSQVYLKIDNDKYVMADENTTFVIGVSGTAKDSKTKINLISGSIISRVDEKLNRNSSYEVITPNSTTAIRGTLVRTKTISNPDQTQSTSTQVFEGSVEMLTVKPDGSIDPTPVQVNKSQTQVSNQVSDLVQDVAQGQAQNQEQNSSEEVNLADSQNQQVAQGQMREIITDAVGQVKTVSKTIDYRKLSPEAIQFLIDSTETGRKLQITNEELEGIKKEAIEEREEEKFKEMYTYHSSSSSSSSSSSNGSTTAGELPVDIPDDTDKENLPSRMDEPFDVVPQTYK